MATTRMRYFEHKRGRVEIIPMIDVMLFLLVFFIIVTLQMIPDAGVALQLPQSSEAQKLDHPQYTVAVQKDGTLTVKGAVLTPAALTAMLRADPNPAKTEVTIAAAKDTPFQAFIRAMDACSAAGVSNVGIATQPQGPAAP